MVVEIFVTLAQRIHALEQQGQLIVSDIATIAGIRESLALTASSNPSRRSACRSNNRPPSLVISPPENRASIRRRFTGGKSKLTWAHSVMGKVQFEFTVTN